MFLNVQNTLVAFLNLSFSLIIILIPSPHKWSKILNNINKTVNGLYLHIGLWEGWIYHVL